MCENKLATLSPDSTIQVIKINIFNAHQLNI